MFLGENSEEKIKFVAFWLCINLTKRGCKRLNALIFRCDNPDFPLGTGPSGPQARHVSCPCFKRFACLHA
jgi:hypothetical protein